MKVDIIIRKTNSEEKKTVKITLRYFDRFLYRQSAFSGRIHNHIFVAIDSAQAFISSAGNCFLGLQKFISSPPLRGTR